MGQRNAQFVHGAVIAFLQLADAQTDVFQIAAESDKFVIELAALFGDLHGEAALFVLLPELRDESRGGHDARGGDQHDIALERQFDEIRRGVQRRMQRRFDGHEEKNEIRRFEAG